MHTYIKIQIHIYIYTYVYSYIYVYSYMHVYLYMHVAIFIHFIYLYSAPSRFLLRSAPDYSADPESEFHAEAHEQLRVKDLPKVPTRRLEVDSNPQPSGCKAPNIPLHHRAPQIIIYI